MRRLTLHAWFPRMFTVLLGLALLPWLGVAILLAQDSIPADTVVSTPDPHTQFVLGLGVLAAYIAREVGSLLVGLWNKAGGFLEDWHNGSKQVAAVVITGALGLLINAVAAALTHSTNWIVTFALSVVAGLVGVVNAGVTIDATKSKMLAANARVRGSL
jgi:hypothetical protein